VAATETALAELMTRRLDDLDLVAFMVDGVHFGEHTCVVALGIDIDGVKHPLAIEEGSTENATLVTDLITGLRDRGLGVTRPILAVLDGAKVLSRAVKDVFGKPLIQRCQQHKIRNVIDKLPDRLRAVTERRMRQAYHAESALRAEGELEQLARELAKTHPGAAASLREGMAETLTILRLDVALAENLIRRRQAACSYSWRIPPRRRRLRMSRWAIWSRSMIGGGSGRSGRALAMP
jgi:putative transposase